ncbi:MAG: SGNH/GDSL hydrolase family protein [Bacteroidota bacterium]
MSKKRKAKKAKSTPPPKSKAPPPAKKIKWGAIALYVLGLFLFQEMVLRLCFPLPELSNFNRIKFQILEPAAGGPSYLRNRAMVWRSYPDTTADFVHQMNRYGYRDQDWSVSKPAGKKRIFFVGDSFVEGMMTTGDQTVPEHFKRAAGVAAGEYDIFNCGMMGIGLNEYTKFLAEAVPIFRPDVVFMVLYANDIPFQKAYQPPTSPEPTYFSFWRPRLLVLIDFIKAKDPIPFRWNNERIPFHQPVPDPGNPWSVKEAEWSPHVRPDLKEAMKQGTFNFFRLNWVLEEEKFLRQATDISTQLQFLKQHLTKYGTELIVFYVPSRSQISNYYYTFERASCQQNCPDQLDLTGPAYQVHRSLLSQQCSSLGFPFYDLTEPVKAEEDRGNHLYWDYDDHMRAKGYKVLGEAIWERWRARQ